MMSKILEHETEFTDIDVIREALEQQGFSPVFNKGYTARTMRGFAGTTFKANLGVRSDNFTEVTGLHTYGDLGFAAKADGTIGFIGDDLLIATPRFVPVFDGIKAAYAEQKYVREFYQNGFALASRNVTTTGEVELNFVPTGGL
jgi:hypothetical protein